MDAAPTTTERHSMTDPHWTPAWQDVTCKACKREYRCTPNDDYYGSTCPTDGVCEACLLKRAGLEGAAVVTLHRRAIRLRRQFLGRSNPADTDGKG